MFKSLFAIILSIACFASQAQASHESYQSSSDPAAAKQKSLEKIASLIAGAWAPYVLKLDHDIDIFHYYEWGVATDVPLNAPVFAQHFVTVSKGFWTGGSPFYAAIDPSQSKNYGSTLIEMHIPKGTRYLDGATVESRGDVISQDLINQIQELATGFPQPESYSPAYGARTDDVFVGLNRPLLARVLAKLNIELSTYNWAGQASVACGRISDDAFMDLGRPTFDSFGQFQSVTTSFEMEGLTSVAKDFSDPAKAKEYLRINRYRHATDGKITLSPDEVSDWASRMYSCGVAYQR